MTNKVNTRGLHMYFDYTFMPYDAHTYADMRV